MIKYKVKDAATDFGLPNKKITEVLKQYCKVDKKTMTAITEEELDVLFDVLTKEHQSPNFEAYFAVRNAKLDIEPEKVTEETTFEDLEIDSLDQVELICELEDRLGIDFGEPEDLQTVGDVIAYTATLK